MIGLEEVTRDLGIGSVLTITRDPPVSNSSFAFIMNVSHLVDASQFELAERYLLRRATEKERTFIKKTLERLNGDTFKRWVWESKRADDGTSEKLPEEEWRYFVISFESSYLTITELQEVFAISPLQLDVGLVAVNPILKGQVLTGFVYRPASLFQSLQSYGHASVGFSEISQADISEIASIHKQLQAHDHQTLDLRRVVRLVMELRDLPPYSPMQFLGYFAVLESLLTHMPKPSDPYESITRQVKQKVALLNRRWKPVLDYNQFKGGSPDKVWKAMYSYRSALAHGSEPNFKKDLAVLGSADNARALLMDTVKKTIRQALKEPELLKDLQEV